MRHHIVTTELRHLRPILRGDIKALYNLLQQMLPPMGARLLFAEPAPTMSGDRIAWFTEIQGVARQLSAVPNEQKQSLFQQLNEQIIHLKNRIKAVSNGQNNVFLSNCLSIPSADNIFLLTTDRGDYYFLLTLWGFVSDKFTESIPTKITILDNIIQKWHTTQLPKSEQPIYTPLPAAIVPPSVKAPEMVKQQPVSPTNNKVIQTDKRLIQRFDLGKTTYTVELSVTNEQFSYFNNLQKYYMYQGQKPTNWKQAYEEMFLENEADLPLLQALLHDLTTLQGGTDRLLIEFVVAYVQGALAYDYAKLKDQNRTKRYPYETIYLEKGVCEDKATLLTKCLIVMGYDAVLLLYEKAAHLAVGLKVPSGQGQFTLGEATYCFIESTNYTAIGEIPETYIGNLKLTERPEIIRARRNGQKSFDQILAYRQRIAVQTAQFGASYHTVSAAGKILLEDMARIKTEMENLNNAGNIEAYNQRVGQYNACSEQYNKIIQT